MRRILVGTIGCLLLAVRPGIPQAAPTEAHVLLTPGNVAFGMRDTFDESTMKTLPAGGYAAMPAEMRHYLKAKTAAVFEVNAMGPFVLTYVNPKDDPRTAAAAK